MIRSVEKLDTVSGPKVVLTMPKFKIDFKYKSIVDHLKALGVTKLFKGDIADFGDFFEQVCSFLLKSIVTLLD